MGPSNCTPIPNGITGHRNLRIPLFRRRLAPPQRDRKNVLATAIPILKRLRGSQRCPAFPSAQRMPRIRTPSNSHIRYTSSVTTSAAPLATCANELQAILQLPHRMRRLLACRSRLPRRLTPSEIRRKCKICKIRVQLTYPRLGGRWLRFANSRPCHVQPPARLRPVLTASETRQTCKICKIRRGQALA